MFSSSLSLKSSIYSRLLIGVLIALMLVTVSGCKKDKNIDDGRSAEEMYETAKALPGSSKTGDGPLMDTRV